MLKASVSSEFLITLPQGQVLPPDFTLEFDLVPKACCNPQDLSFEGTPTINQGAGSAHVLWDSDGYLAVIGGGPNNYEAPMPEDLRTTLPGVLTRVVAVVQGPTIRLYTNGRRHYTLDKQFARGRVLRVFLGVDPEAQDPVHLAGLRILAGAFPPTAGIPIAGSSPMQPPPPVGTLLGGATKPPGTVVGGTASQSQASTGGSVPTTVSNVSVTQGTAGPVVSWQPVSVPAAYLVRRWKIDDVACCSNASPAASPLTGPPWQDAPLSVAGTYVYEVTATMSGGIASGQAQFVHFAPGGQIASAAPGTPPSAPVILNAPAGPATSTTPGTGTLPRTLGVTATAGTGPDLGTVRVTWTHLAVPHVISVRRWKSDDLNCCNFSTGNIGGFAVALNDPLLQKGVLPGTYVYEVTATLYDATATTIIGSVQGQALFTVPATPTTVPSQPSQPTGTTVPTTPTVPTPIAAQTGQPVAGTARPLPSSIVPVGPPPQNVSITGTPAYATLAWSSPISGMRGLVYSVQRWMESDPACCNAQVYGIATTRWMDEGVQWPGAYVYRISVTLGDGSVGSVDTRWVRPDPVNPTNFRTAAVSTGSVTLQWDPVPGASWYELSGPGVPNGSFQAMYATFTVRGLAPGSHTWRVGTFYSSPNAPAPVSSAASAFPQLTVTVP